jgi:hypothetical protein
MGRMRASFCRAPGPGARDFAPFTEHVQGKPFEAQGKPGRLHDKQRKAGRERCAMRPCA